MPQRFRPMWASYYWAEHQTRESFTQASPQRATRVASSLSILRVFARIVACIPAVGVRCAPTVADCLLALAFITVRIVRHQHGSGSSVTVNRGAVARRR